MQIAAPVHVTARFQPEASAWELILRYVAATAATLLAIAGAQLVVPNDFIVLLTILTVIGVPISLYLRVSDMQVGPIRVPRPLLNGATVIGTAIVGGFYLLWPMRDLLLPILNGGSANLLFMRFGAGELVGLLMQLFLLFAAFRSFALISDKDATLATVPSFSVLLLLIPVHKGIEVVFYFLAWTIVATVLFALDHRSEMRALAVAYVPSVAPGQDVKMAGRSLGTILGFSMIAAIGISFFLTSRDPQQRSSAETAISSLATRLTNMALSLPESSVNSGPERQIDFTSNPTPVTRSELWQVSAWTWGGKLVRPEYWRMFSLDRYNGASWAQSTIVGGQSVTKRITLAEMSTKRWPSRREFRRPPSLGMPSLGMPSRGFERREAPEVTRQRIPNPVETNRPMRIPLEGGGTPSRGGAAPVRPFFNFSQNAGFDVQKANPVAARQLGPPDVLLRQNVMAKMPNIGYIPVTPSVRAVILDNSEQKEIRAQRDGALDLGVVEPGQMVRVLSDVPALAEYGVPRGNVPSKKLTPEQIKRSGVALSAVDRRSSLALPPSLPMRTRELAKSMLADAAPDESNNRLAQRLALAIQENAVYTLRPPSVPANRDAADYFLFEGRRRGYCTYFAGALAVLCRTQGIPARVVSGFVNPEWEVNSSNGILREANAHAWTEVWTEGWGWTLIDATPASDRGDNAPTWYESWNDWFVSGTANAIVYFNEHLTLIGASSAFFIMLILVRWQKRRTLFSLRSRARYSEDAERKAVLDIYNLIARQIARRFRPRARWETADEWLQPFAATLDATEAEAIRRLTALYLMASYAGKPLPQGTAQLARQAARNIKRKNPSR
jgi:uncharacterized membrane protein